MPILAFFADSMIGCPACRTPAPLFAPVRRRHVPHPSDPSAGSKCSCHLHVRPSSFLRSRRQGWARVVVKRVLWPPMRAGTVAWALAIACCSESRADWKLEVER
ncbi:hypothetical protein GGX14DRAFT_562733 [Mycena pura]|uniref:Uncharacterized protein n=1 Tax=Mycena pura TaxID=153505 RepID=A0AAD6VKA9_9AGAR|nr:hypothetical protein GGX14DRAFT_562733 [Mycena pura]